jgi:hypothetical protein
MDLHRVRHVPFTQFLVGILLGGVYWFGRLLDAGGLVVVICLHALPVLLVRAYVPARDLA